MCDFIQINTPYYKVIALRIVDTKVVINERIHLDIDLVCETLDISKRIISLSDEGEALKNRQNNDISIKKNNTDNVISETPFIRYYLVLYDATQQHPDLDAVCVTLEELCNTSSYSSESSSSSETSESSLGTPFIISINTAQFVDPSSLNQTLDTQFRLTINESYDYDYFVDWGDGSTDHVICLAGNIPTIIPVVTVPGSSTDSGTIDTKNGAGTSIVATLPYILHTYPTSGVYDVEISHAEIGSFPAIRFHDPAGTSGSMPPLAKKQTDGYKVLEIKNWGTINLQTMYTAFEGCSNLQITATDILSLNITNWDQAFTQCRAMTYFPHVEMSHATNMNSMFNGCVSLVGIAPTLDLSNVQTFVYAFVNCESLLSFPAFDFSNATNISNAWRSCFSLLSFPAIYFPNVTNATNAWYDCTSMVTFGECNFPECTNFTAAWQNCSSLVEFPLIDVSKGQSFVNAWINCVSLTGFPALQLLSATSVSNTWRNCPSMTSFGQVVFGPNCTNFTEAWRVAYGFTSFPTLDLSMGTNFTRTWFWNLNLESFPALDLSAGTNFTECWLNCDKLTAVNIGNCDVSNGVTFTSAFRNCQLLDDYPHWNFIKMKSASLMFADCPSLTTEKYDSFLQHLVDTCIENSVSFGTGSVKHSIGLPFYNRTILTNAPRSWTIVDGGSNAFTITVVTTNPGSASTDFILPLDPAENYDFTVSWEGLSYETITNLTLGFPNISHTYPTTGTKTVRIVENVIGGFPKIFFNNGGDKLKVTAITQWFINRWSNGVGSWYGCANMTTTATDPTTAETQYITDMTDWANECSKITGASSLRLNSCDIFTRAWKDCKALTTIGASIQWKAAPLSMESAFEGCSVVATYTGPPLIIGSAAFMFKSAPLFNVDISSWILDESVTSLEGMFHNATAFNRNISLWDVRYVTNMNALFTSAANFNQDISSWNVESVVDMRSIFYNAIKFKRDIGEWWPRSCLFFDNFMNGIDVNSLISPTNLCSNQQDFGNSSWTKINATVLTNVINAPDGTLTADRVRPSATNSTDHSVRTSNLTVVIGSSYTFRCAFKADILTYGELLVSGGITANVYADLTTGTIISSNGTVSVTDIGDGWFVLEIIGTPTTTTVQLKMKAWNNAAGTSFSGNGVNGIYLWQGSAFLSSSSTANLDSLFKNWVGWTGGLLGGPTRTGVVVTPTVNFGGSGYTVGDILTVSGGTIAIGSAIEVEVETTDVFGAVLTVILVRGSGNYDTQPANPAATIGGTGMGCDLDLVWVTKESMLPSGVQFHNGNARYSIKDPDVISARKYLTATKSWIISGNTAI